MYNSKNYIIEDLKSQKELKRQYERRLKTLPEGMLSTATVKGITYYYKKTEGKKTFLGRADKGRTQEIKQLQIKRFLTESLKRIEQNCKVMDKMIKKYKSIEPDEINSCQSKAYQLFEQSDYHFTDWSNLQEWGSAQYDKNTKYPEGLIHRTLKGECVRSKSEVIIADMLFLKGIEYHYEENLKLGKEIIAPDFKVRVPGQGRFRIIEHFGLIGNAKYLEECLWKIRLYINYGYTPWEDIIFTFDAHDGSIDAHLIGWIIDYLCT